MSGNGSGKGGNGNSGSGDATNTAQMGPGSGSGSGSGNHAEGGAIPGGSGSGNGSDGAKEPSGSGSGELGGSDGGGPAGGSGSGGVGKGGSNRDASPSGNGNGSGNGSEDGKRTGSGSGNDPNNTVADGGSGGNGSGGNGSDPSATAAAASAAVAAARRPKFHVLIASHDAASQDLLLLRQVAWETLILVEDVDSHRSVTMSMLPRVGTLQSANRVLMLNGPIPRTIGETLTIMDFIKQSPEGMMALERHLLGLEDAMALQEASSILEQVTLDLALVLKTKQPKHRGVKPDTDAPHTTAPRLAGFDLRAGERVNPVRPVVPRVPPRPPSSPVVPSEAAKNSNSLGKMHKMTLRTGRCARFFRLFDQCFTSSSLFAQFLRCVDHNSLGIRS